mmetsp:Transcript_1411/g.3935  ORF Transcript_1411/g.3935 Transcript_1411/m.3935 type:complete len:316 (+) Transcript_1411:958-1905(+)
MGRVARAHERVALQTNRDRFLHLLYDLHPNMKIDESLFHDKRKTFAGKTCPVCIAMREIGLSLVERCDEPAVGVLIVAVVRDKLGVFPKRTAHGAICHVLLGIKAEPLDAVRVLVVNCLVVEVIVRAISGDVYVGIFPQTSIEGRIHKPSHLALACLVTVVVIVIVRQLHLVVADLVVVHDRHLGSLGIDGGPQARGSGQDGLGQTILEVDDRVRLRVAALAVDGLRGDESRQTLPVELLADGQHVQIDGELIVHVRIRFVRRYLCAVEASALVGGPSSDRGRQRRKHQSQHQQREDGFHFVHRSMCNAQCAMVD